MTITAIIQARMTSTRLPGKVLMKAKGKPLLEWQLRQISTCKTLGEVVIATTTNVQDDPIVDLAREMGFNCFRGSEFDVLDRYYQAAVTFNASHVMRLTADCPLLQPDICDKIAQEYLDGPFDYVATGFNFVHGVNCEAFSFQALKTNWSEAKDPYEREHVTPYIYRNKDKFQTKRVYDSEDNSRYRITVDYEEDYVLVKHLIENVEANSHGYIAIQDIKTYLDENPHIYEINKLHICRHSVE